MGNLCFHSSSLRIEIDGADFETLFSRVGRIAFFGGRSEHCIPASPISYFHPPLDCTELAKRVCPRLRDLGTAPAGGITQPRTNFIGQLCILRCVLGADDVDDALSPNWTSVSWAK